MAAAGFATGFDAGFDSGFAVGEASASDSNNRLAWAGVRCPCLTSRLAIDSSVSVAGPLEISHVQNSGIAFGLFSQSTSLVIVLTSAVVLWMVVFFAHSGARHPLLPAALGLVVGGSVSNLFDRVTNGYVTDFVDFGLWPTFNLADFFIVLGVAALIFFLIAPDRYLPRSTCDSSQAPGR